MNSQDNELSRRLRARLLLIAWVVALLVTDAAGVIHCGVSFALFGVACVWAFPTGMYSLVFRDGGPELGFAASISVFVLLWLCYLGLTLLAFRQRRRLRYLMVYGLLCVLLLLNAVGCNYAIVDTAKAPLGHMH
jgi:hypothetical protein